MENAMSRLSLDPPADALGAAMRRAGVEATGCTTAANNSPSSGTSSPCSSRSAKSGGPGPLPRTCFILRFVTCRPVGHHARQNRDLGYPSTVILLVELDLQHYGLRPTKSCVQDVQPRHESFKAGPKMPPSPGGSHHTRNRSEMDHGRIEHETVPDRVLVERALEGRGTTRAVRSRRPPWIRTVGLTLRSSSSLR